MDEKLEGKRKRIAEDGFDWMKKQKQIAEDCKLEAIAEDGFEVVSRITRGSNHLY